MPRVPEARVIAIAVADIHLSHAAPVSRADKSWYDAMARPLREIKILRAEHECPIICAGDVFDKWSPPAQLINFALDELPNMISIPGQHDLPNHRYEDVEKSGYWTLVRAGRLTNLSPEEGDRPNYPINGGMVWGFPWGSDVSPPDHPILDGFHVALIHTYVWRKESSYPGANLKQHMGSWRKRLKDYRVAVFGDNHKGFLSSGEPTTILNCGGMLRRKSDEQDYKPSVGLIWSDGDVTRHRLDTSRDVLLTTKEVIQKTIERAGSFSDFVESAKNLSGEVREDFVSACRAIMDEKKVDDRVRKFVVNALEGEK